MKIEALKFPILGVFAAVAFAGAAALPQVTDVTFSRRSKGSVQVDYTLDQAAVVTFDVVTNGVSIGAANLTTVVGDVFCEVSAGRHSIRWSAGTEWSGNKADDLDVRVQAWALDDKPDYMVVNLADGAIAYYPSVEWLPGGLLNGNQYKTDKLVLRRIHAKNVTWTMGGQFDGGSGVIDENHDVTLTNDYYLAIFEMTQKQFSTVYGSSIAVTSGHTTGDAYPQDNLNYYRVRENANGANSPNPAYQYPNPPCPDSFLGKLRKLTDNTVDFDLPSEAQWEFAARGTAPMCGHYNTGHHYKDKNYLMPGAGSETTGKNVWAEVGSYAPNAWGLYDCHGNIGVWCVDWYTNDIRDLNGAVCLTPNADQKRSIRGVDANQNAGQNQRLSKRNSGVPRNAGGGVRVMCVNGLK